MAESDTTYSMLENKINKWMSDLDEEENNCITQATQVNAWDNIIRASNISVLALNRQIEELKSAQSTCEEDLEFLSAQIVELVDCLQPLSQELITSNPVNLEGYEYAEKLDSLLNEMSESIRELFETVNEHFKNLDWNGEVVQVSKILNALMVALRWIESSTNTIMLHVKQLANTKDEIVRMQGSILQ